MNIIFFRYCADLDKDKLVIVHLAPALIKLFQKSKLSFIHIYVQGKFQKSDISNRMARAWFLKQHDKQMREAHSSRHCIRHQLYHSQHHNKILQPPGRHSTVAGAQTVPVNLSLSSLLLQKKGAYTFSPVSSNYYKGLVAHATWGILQGRYAVYVHIVLIQFVVHWEYSNTFLWILEGFIWTSNKV